MVEIKIDALVILPVPLRKNLLPVEAIEYGKDVPHLEDRAEEPDKGLLRLLADNGRTERIDGLEFGNQFTVSADMFSFVVSIAVVVVVEGFEHHDAARVGVAEERDAFVGLLLQVAETDDVAEGLDRVQNAVGARIGLKQTVVTEIFIDPERVERGGVESGQEHVHHDQKVDFAVLHPQRNVFVVVLELLGGGVVTGLKHRVVIGDGRFKKVARRGVEPTGVFGILLVEKPFRLRFVDVEAVDQRHLQPPGGIGFHLPLEFAVVEFCRVDGGDGEDRIEAGHPDFPLDLLDFVAVAGGGDGGDVGERAEIERPVVAAGFLIEMLQNVPGDVADPGRIEQCFFAIDAGDLFILDVLLFAHGADVFDPEGENVSVADGVDDRVGVQHVAERLFGGLEVGAAAGTGVFRGDRRPGESEDVILFEGAGDRLVHVAELRAVTLVEDDDEMARIDLVILLLLDEDRKFLDRGDDDAGVRVLELPFQDSGAGVAVGGAFFEAVVLLHGLVVEVLAVDHEEHLVDVGQPRGELSGFERGERLAAAGGVPDVAAGLEGAVLPVIGGEFDAVQNPFGRDDLIGAHDQELFFGSEDAVFRQDRKQRMPGEEGLAEIHQVADRAVAGVGPP